jgi:hypothetical protein
MKSMILSAAALATLVGSANAALFVESESNNTLGTANNLGTYGPPGEGIVIDGTITSGDVDWFQFTINGTGTYVVAAAFAIPASTNSTDGVMQLVNSAGVVLEFDDDDNIGFMPSLEFAGLTAGTYYIGLSGFGDASSSSVGTTDVLDGLTSSGAAHSENWDYKMVLGLNIIPAPGSIALLGLGGLAMARRRR